MVTLERIKCNIQDVTSEQIGRCHKVWDHQTHEDFYLVENESGDFNEDGELIEYKVQYTSQYGFTCTCKAGQVGFSRITSHPSGVCKHVRWSVACWLEEEVAMQELNEREKAAKEKGTLQHPQEFPIVRAASTDIEARMPAIIWNAKPAPHMRYAPKELR